MTPEDDCTTIVRQLWPHLDGALPGEWEARVVEHLSQCGACRSHVEFEGGFLDAVREAGGASGAEIHRLQARVLAALSSQGFTRPR